MKKKDSAILIALSLAIYFGLMYLRAFSLRWAEIVHSVAFFFLKVGAEVPDPSAPTVTVENSDETFTGEFDAQTTGIRDVRWKKEDGRSIIYNLQGQRLHSLQKGLNIVNGQKVFVK